jgi:hypothetical protein
MTAAPDDPELLARARSGERTAFDALVAPHLARLRSFLHRLVGAWLGIDHDECTTTAARLFARDQEHGLHQQGPDAGTLEPLGHRHARESQRGNRVGR